MARYSHSYIGTVVVVALACAASLALTALAPARAAATAQAPLGSITLTYSATISDQDTCTVDTSGSLTAPSCNFNYDYASGGGGQQNYTGSYSGDINASVPIKTADNLTTPGTGSGPATESNVQLSSSGTFAGGVSLDCTGQTGNENVTYNGSTIASTLDVKRLSATRDQQGNITNFKLLWNPPNTFENVTSAGVYTAISSNCSSSLGPFSVNVESGEGSSDISTVTPNPGPWPAVTNWTINPFGNWTAQTGGVLAQKVINATTNFAAPDSGPITVDETFQIVTHPSKLVITSPPDKSTVAISDPTYVDGAQIGPKDRAPVLTTLKLKVSGTSACAGPVTVNGVSAPVTGSTWNAEIPISTLTGAALGQATLKASAAGCGQVSNTVTLINLNITNPAENQNEPITDAPAMPQNLNAAVSVTGYPGDTSGVSFDWTLDLRGMYKDRNGWHAYPQSLITGSETGTQTPWNPPPTPVIGGVGRLSVTATLPGVLGGTVQSFPRWINVPGTNPKPAAVNKEVADLDATDADTIEHIFCFESGGQGVDYPQFNPVANKGEPAFADIPADWGPPNPPVLQPHYGAPPAGIGIAQKDPAVFPGQQWDWTQNVSAGVAEYQGDLAAAQALQSNEQARLDNERKMAIAITGVPANTVPRKIVPAETPVYPVPPVTADAITRYNTGAGWNTYYFDYHYLVTPSGTVVEQGSGQWVTKDGQWQKYNKWIAAGGVKVARTWTANPKWDPKYVAKVTNCTPPQ